jgi:phosphoribosylaminoimidazole-succinocarboxamide synthase
MTIDSTDFQLPGQTAVYHGKVRDVYTINNDTVVMVATDRISAFDVILPRAIPYKGQVLNQIAAYFLQKTSDIVPNWLQTVPDPNVSLGIKAEPFKVEVVVRACLVGSAWREYAAGNRELCGNALPEGMEEYDKFDAPILTPTTKEEEGHDQNISETEIIAKGYATEEEWQEVTSYARQVFARGQEMAQAQGLVLADTKYEFGRVDGKIILIDEIHTPDSARYFYADSYEKYIAGDKSERPKQLSKEFVREWLMANHFSGQAGETMPEMTDEFVASITDRYIELYEKITGQTFAKAETDDILGRIESNIQNALKERA